MVNISECSSDNQELASVLRMVKLIIPKLDVSKVYNLEVNGENKYLIKVKNSFFVINVEDGLFSSVDIFAVNDDGNICSLKIHDSNTIINDGIVMQFNNEVLPSGDLDDDCDDFDYYNYRVGCVEKSLRISPIDIVKTRYAGYNAVINYLEYNFLKGISLFYNCFFQAKFDGTDKIRESYLGVPLHLNVVSLGSVDVTKDDEEYFLTEWYREHRFYKVALFKLKGLMSLISNEENDFQFYYDKPLFDENGRLNIWNFITSSMYDIAYLKKKMIDKGFVFDVPKELLDMFNGECEEYLYCQNILDEYNRKVFKKKC